MIFFQLAVCYFFSNFTTCTLDSQLNRKFFQSPRFEFNFSFKSFHKKWIKIIILVTFEEGFGEDEKRIFLCEKKLCNCKFVGLTKINFHNFCKREKKWKVLHPQIIVNQRKIFKWKKKWEKALLIVPGESKLND